MNASMFCCLLVLCVTPVFSVTISTRDIQRKFAGESCVFRWNITENFTSYAIKMSTGSSADLGPNTYHSFNSRTGVITLLIWNIQTSNAGYYSLSVSTAPFTEVNSIAVLFVYDVVRANTIQALGRNPGFEGDKIELNCSAYSQSQPAAYQNKLYYFWYNDWYGFLRNTSSGPAVLQNGDILPGYSIKGDGKTLVIDYAQYTDNWFRCSVKEEGSPYNSMNNGPDLRIYSRPYTYEADPPSRKFNAALNWPVSLSIRYLANPPLSSYSNWNFVNASGSTEEYSMGNNLFTSDRAYFAFTFGSVNSYGNYSIVLTNSNGSRTETFQVIPQGPPDVPSSFNVQYVTHSLVSLLWRCMWSNGAQQTVFVRLTDVATNTELETQAVSLAPNCYNSVFSTLFQSNIQPETDYVGSIWSLSTLGSSDVVKLAVRTPKRLIFDTSSANISIAGTQATINFRITDTTKAIFWLNITCCVELTTQCSNQSYIISITDNRISYDILPTGTEYIFDFIVYDSDGFTYVYTLAFVKGVRVSRTEGKSDSTKYLPRVEKGKTLVDAVIVLAVLLGVAVLMLIGCIIGFLVHRCRGKNSHQQSTAAHIPTPTRPKAKDRETSEYANAEDHYEPVLDVDPSNENAYYKTLESSGGTDKQYSGAWQTEQSPKLGEEISDNQRDGHEQLKNDIYYIRPDGTLDRPKRNRNK